MEILIDRACGVPDGPPPALPTHKEEATRISLELIHHIDIMYPKMWEGCPKSARTSIGNTVYNKMLHVLSVREMKEAK